MLTGLDRYGLLDKVIRISNSTVDVERRLKNLLRLLAREMNVDRAALFNLDREAGALILRVTDDEDTPREMRLRLEHNFIAAAVLAREAVIVGPEDPEVVPEEYRDRFKGFVTLAAFPIMDDQVLYGVLALLDREPKTYSPQRAALIETIAREIAGTIRNSRLYTESKKRIAELSVLYEVGRAVSSTIDLELVLNTIVNITCKVLLAEGCALNVMDTTTNRLSVAAEYGHLPPACRFKSLLETPSRTSPDLRTCMSIQRPFLGRAREYTQCRGMREEGGDKSILCLPLNFKGHFKGTLSLFNKVAAPPGRPREFNREDLELLLTMGTMISSSVENAMTFQAVDELARKNEQLVRDLSLLYEISGAMMTTVKMDGLLSIIIKALTSNQGLDFDRAMILVMNEEEDTLLGAARRERRPEEKEREKRSLAELLKECLDETPTCREGNGALNLVLPLEGAGEILVRTVKEKRSFNFGPGEERRLADTDLPSEFGRLYLATVPMLAKGKVVGVIAVDRDLSRSEINAEDMRKLSMLANQAGLAIENSRLYEYIEMANLTLSQTRERLIEAEKMAALGEMAAGMAHEIRNPLVSIGGFTRRLLKTMNEDSPHKVYVEVIINEVTRLEKTLSEILDFSRDTLSQFEEVNINDVVSEALYIMRREFKEELIEVAKEMGDVPTVLIDVRQIKQVLFNLFFNACQAMESGGGLRVKTYLTKEGDRAFVATEVTDTGPGISPEVLPNIFNPFFTTKDAGTGLGLSIVHKIVSRHHGEIDVVNREGQGASFIIKLPVAAEAGLYLK
ncbi:MAG: GAF domain-containing protein [Thermodesulfobacteriota bacterium]